MIEVANLQKSFRLSHGKRFWQRGKHSSVNAVQSLSFACRPGRVFTLLGPNGAGKTTTLRMIATMIKPDSGHIRVAGYDVSTQPREVRRRLGFLTGSTGLYDRLTANELTKYFADLNRMTTASFKSRREELFDLLGISGFADRRIGKLSTGMKQKVSIARTLIHDPEVIVLDEPTAGLDVISAKSIMQLIRDLKTRGKTVIFSTHIMGEVGLLSDDLAIIHQGELRYQNTFESFRGQFEEVSLVDAFIRIVEDKGHA